ncbi:hypothetical protein SM124_10080 [Bacillus sp. 31A1R]|uniref:Uncharacterized protein n=1 Tax=Robertmurraya mangrovi TaxID=3098077 RepID=A0ABU5IY54_9BACI|nr:hypothetical protein [Bacillus sp. 31A1R]MDZ5472095.1 hypothetical protein [Bacillus sp. 31A1R]
MADKDEFYKLLKMLGAKAEYQINEWIKECLNKEEIIQLFSNQSSHYSKAIKNIQEKVETLSIPFNFPTKGDVASLAKLTIQNEEKLEAIEEQINQLNELVRKLKKGSNITDKLDENETQHLTTIENFDNSNENISTNQQKSLKRIKKLNLILQNHSSSNLDSLLTALKKENTSGRK